jgi:hypothetical protein
MKVFTMKFCINCKHFSPLANDLEHQFSRCSHNQTPSLITGTLMRGTLPFCLVARIDGSGKCGADGNNYEEKAVSHV